MANHIWVMEVKDTNGWVPSPHAYASRVEARAVRDRWREPGKDRATIFRVVKYVRSEPRQTRSKRRSPEVATQIRAEILQAAGLEAINESK